MLAGIAVYTGTRAIDQQVSKSKEAEDELAQRRPYSNNKSTHSVYALINQIRESQYVGRIVNSVETRYAQHNSPDGKGVGLRPVTIASNLTYPQARGIEHIVYEHYIRAGNDMRNSINPISPNNPNKFYYILEGGCYLASHPDVMREIIKWDKK